MWAESRYTIGKAPVLPGKAFANSPLQGRSEYSGGGMQ